MSTEHKTNGHDIVEELTGYTPSADFKTLSKQMPEMEQLPDGKGYAIKKTPKYDPITNPEHYCKGDIEPWEFIEAQNLGFHEGSAVSYIARARHKGDEIGDLRKAINFLTRKVKLLEQAR